MAILLVPPTRISTENPEWPKLMAKEAQAFRAERLQSLGGASLPEGGPLEVQSVPWSGAQDAILYTTLVLAPKTPKPTVWGRWAVLVRAQDCLHMGAWWQWEKTLPGIPQGGKEAEGGVLRTEARGLAPEGQGTTGWQVEIRGKGAARFQDWMEVALADSLLEQKKIVIHNSSRFFCSWSGVPPPKPLAKTLSYPARPHGVFHLRFHSTAPLDRWPLGQGTVGFSGGVFGEGRTPEPKSIAPNTTLALGPVLGLSVKLVEAVSAPLGGTLQVIKRQGRWIYLNRGRAWGLTIGQWLVTPGGAKMHVVQFAPGETTPDVAIAYLRSEKDPVKAGDTVQMDPTVFKE